MNKESAKTRDYSLDNIRFFLIFFVVFAHLLEVCSLFNDSRIIYQLIYSFHMPAFIFLFGYNVKFSPKKIIFNWCIPYIVFQTVYIIFSNLALNKSLDLQYTTPYWLLWYMLVCVFYQLLLPLIDTDDKRKQVIILVCAFILSLLVGFDNTISYYLSLSRFFVFLPWFLLGVYCKKNGILTAFSARKKLRLTALVISLTGIALSALFIYRIDLINGFYYGSFPYQKFGNTVWDRIIVFFMALCWIVFLFVGVKPFINKKILLLTAIGQNTWPVFLLHGFIVKAIPVYLPD
ncbi:MAG: acyltransferase family protein, partial [Ruminiclostridium sp.]|nr:acyltransferase family protein [Ruminiclostridium sp.]